MKSSRPRNQRLSSPRERRKKFLIDGVNKRGRSAAWSGFCRWTGHLLKVLALGAFAAGIYYGSTHGWRKFVSENPDYAVKEIQFSTDGTLTREQALQITQIKLGQNIISANLDDARNALRKLPQVTTAEIRRYLPNRIEITVTETTPTAWVVPKLSDETANPGQAYLLDARGLVFQPKHVPYEFQALPTIGGVQIEDLEPGKRIRKAEVNAALELLRRARDSGSFKVMTVDVSKGYCMVVTDQRRAQLTFGLDDIAGQLNRLAIVQSETALIGQEIKTINLIPVRNIPVTFLPPTPPETDEFTELPPPPPVTKSVTHTAPKSTNSVSPKVKTQPSRKKSEPSKPKEEPNKENIGLLKRFRTA